MEMTRFWTRRNIWACLLVLFASILLIAGPVFSQNVYRLTDIRVSPYQNRVEISLLGEGLLRYRTYWIERTEGNVLVVEYPEAFLSREIEMDFTAGTDFTSDLWTEWPLMSVNTAQLFLDTPVVRASFHFAPTFGGHPAIAVAEGGSQVVLTVARPGLQMAEPAPLPSPVRPAAAQTRLAEPPSSTTMILRDPEPEALVIPARRFSLVFQNSDIATVLHSVADQAGLNLIVDPQVSGEVTVRLRDVALEQALDAILSGTDYAWVVEDGFIRVLPAASLARFRVVIPVRNANPERLLTLLRSYVSSPQRLGYEPTSHAIIYVADDEREAANIRGLAAELNRITETRPSEGQGRPYMSTVPLFYAEPEKIAELVQAMMNEDGLTIMPNLRSRAVVIRAPDEIVLERAMKLIRSVDNPTPQVLLKARIVETTVDMSDLLGIEWSSGITFTASGVSQTSKFPLRLDEPFGNGPGDGITLGSLNVSSLSATIRFLETQGNSVLLSAPEILVLDGEEAEIIVGAKEPVRTTVTSDGVVSENVEFLDVGIVLRVSPDVLHGKQVMLRVHPENSSAGASDIAGVPRISTSEATTRILVEHGRTAVIGGLYSQARNSSERRVPFLSSLPLIGELFRSSSDDFRRRNLIVFITPYVVGASGMPEPAVISGGPDHSPMGRWVQGFRDEDREWQQRIYEDIEMKNETSRPARIPVGGL